MFFQFSIISRKFLTTIKYILYFFKSIVKWSMLFCELAICDARNYLQTFLLKVVLFLLGLASGQRGSAHNCRLPKKGVFIVLYFNYTSLLSFNKGLTANIYAPMRYCFEVQIYTTYSTQNRVCYVLNHSRKYLGMSKILRYLFSQKRILILAPWHLCNN